MSNRNINLKEINLVFFSEAPMYRVEREMYGFEREDSI